MLSSNQIKAVELLAYNLMTQEAVAQKLRVHKNTISNWKKNNEFANALYLEGKKSMNNAGVIALRVMVGLLTSEKEEIRLRSAKDILDRIGYKVLITPEVDKKLEDVLLTDKEFKELLGDDYKDRIREEYEAGRVEEEGTEDDEA